MRTRGDKRPSRKNDRKVLVAEESNRNWADTDSDSSSSSSSSSDSEQEEFHCLMADQTSDDEDIVFDARSIFSFSGEQVSTSCKKREMKFEFRLLSDILEKTISVKAAAGRNSTAGQPTQQYSQQSAVQSAVSSTVSSQQGQTSCWTIKPALTNEKFRFWLANSSSFVHAYKRDFSILTVKLGEFMGNYTS
ncbi:hypothetical protein F511_39267 [Dorcoceras hygrometricum]|uniref:Uncharacterized protein n=1 Tax=Dorcoceras hygrometricum TaxID=472368 RepID=A0A2Z7B9I1_9LAMI|nr:hypothetical protein F511_39267 [Dorcoceras hygrometricum]